MPGVWNAGAESVWFPKTKQVSAPTSEIHSTNHPSGFDCFTQAKTAGIDSCWFETRKHHVARSCQTTLQSEGKKNIIKVKVFITQNLEDYPSCLSSPFFVKSARVYYKKHMKNYK